MHGFLMLMKVLVIAGNLDERLPLNCSLGEFGIQEITVVSKSTKISNSVSSADIIALQQTDEGRGKCYMESSFKHSRSVSLLTILILVTFRSNLFKVGSAL